MTTAKQPEKRDKAEQPQRDVLTTPFNPEAELGVLAYLISNPRTITRVIDTLLPEHFWGEHEATVYEAIVNLYRRGKVATVPNVRDELRRMQRYDSTAFMLPAYQDSNAPLFGTITDYADMVKDACTYRRLLSFGEQVMVKAYNRDPNLISWAEDEFLHIVLGADAKPVTAMPEAVDRYMSAYEQRRLDFKAGKRAGLSTGYPDLDRLIGGFLPSKLYLLGARTGIGKSAAALNFALHLLRAAAHVLLFSCEMDEDEIMQRLFSIGTRIDQTLLRDANTDEGQHALMRSAAADLRKLDLKLDDRVVTLDDICHKAKAVHATKPLSMIVVDYTQLLKLREGGRARNEMRHEELGDISMGLKSLSRELRVPVLALAQLGRKSEEHELPGLADLAESDRLGRDSDVVMLMHVDESEQEKRNKSEPFRVQVLVRKQRGGRFGQVSLMYTPGLTRFDPLYPEVRNAPYSD